VSKLFGGLLLMSALATALPASAHDRFRHTTFGFQWPRAVTPYYYAPPVVLVPARPRYYPAPVYAAPGRYLPPGHHHGHHYRPAYRQHGGGLTIVVPFGR